MRILLAALVVMASSACSANHKSIHRVTNLEGTGPVVISVDAKQRAIIANYRPYQGNGNRTNEVARRICSEPSPDVFSVFAQSLSVGGSFGQAASPATVEAAVNAAFSSSENGSTIARTQSVNLLREIMFRTCERYMNGAIDELEMTIQAARDHRLIVSILAIEQLTGAVTPRPVTISASGSGTAGASADAMLVLEDARKGLVRAEDEAKAAKTAFDEVNTAEKVCEADPVLDANKAKCDEKRSAMTKANEARGKAAERYQLLSGLARAGGVSVSTTTEANAPGGTLGVQPTSIKDVAAAVENIVLMNTETDEFVFFCIRSFSNTDFMARLEVADPSGKILSTCVDYISKGITAEAEQRFSTRLYNEAVGEIRVSTDTSFDAFWTRTTTSGAFDKAKFQQIVAAANPGAVGRNKLILEQIARLTDRDEILKKFRLLTARWQAVLAGK